jgi:hypothetical protein
MSMRKSVVIPRSRIAEKAYALYLERGRTDGCDVEDWLRAERLLQDEATEQVLPSGRTSGIRPRTAARRRPAPQI